MNIWTIVGYIFSCLLGFIIAVVLLSAIMSIIVDSSEDINKIKNIKISNIKKIIKSFFLKIIQYIKSPSLIIKYFIDKFYVLLKNIIIFIKELAEYIFVNAGKIFSTLFLLYCAYELVSSFEKLYFEISSISQYSVSDLLEISYNNSEIKYLEKIEKKMYQFKEGLNFFLLCILIGYILMYAKIKEYEKQIEELKGDKREESF